MFDLFGTGVKLHAPPLSSIKLFPDDPLTLPPPSEQGTLKCPFPIDPEFYNAALATTVPITFAAGYFTFVVLMNQINRRRTYRAWGLSKTKAFFGFTVIHNILLALYSAVTFAAMVRMVYVSFPGWFGEHGVVGAVDGLCKMHGPRGYGEAVTYNSTTQSWSSKNHFVNLGPGGILPDDTDVGRFWNEGLAFWGWFFYLSKFYEVLDTVIILAKGKRSSTLQTYHHTGAMFCMWAGIRYMSTPIYLFVLINSFIHSLMYTFYTVSTLGFKVPLRLKRTITSLQILQLVTGFFYAGAHHFISYDTPVSTIVKLASKLSSPAGASEAASELFASATQAAQSNGELPAWLKRLAYRAVGAEGLAEAVRDSPIYTDRRAAENRWGQNTTEQERQQYSHAIHYETVPCLDTSGQVFAIWLNVVYLAPLIFLFVRFFIKSYIKKANQDAKAKTGRGSFNTARRWSESAQEAARRTSELVEHLGVNVEEAVDDATEEIEETVKATNKQAKKAVAAVKESDVGSKIGEKAEQASNAVKNSDPIGSVKDSKAAEKVQEAVEAVKTSEMSASAKKKAKRGKDRAKEAKLEESFTKIKDEAKNTLAQATGARDAGEVVEDQEKAKTTKKSNGDAKADGSPLEGSFVQVKGGADKVNGEAKPDEDAPSSTNQGEPLSYAEAIKEDLAEDDHGEQPKPVENPVDVPRASD